MNERTLVIAEIGENHIGDWDLARDMVAAAAEAGADVVKFQSYRGEDVADEDPEKEWFGRVELTNEMHFELKELAEENGVEFLSSPFTLERGRFLVEELGLRKIKVASSEMVNWSLLDYLNDRVEAVYLSTGLATLDEVRESLSHLDDVEEVFLFQCTTQYPCPPEEANLAVVRTLKEAFPDHGVGFSDHTLGILAPMMAVALGAEVIEKHFTMDRSLPGTDHVLSVTPDELEEMVERIREVEVLLGTAEKRPTGGEEEIKEFVRTRFPKD